MSKIDMSVKMIVTDLDNTLLRCDKTVSEYTASVFYRCKEAGIKIVFATARPVRAVTKWLSINIQSDACIYHNGAVIHIGDKPFQETGIGHETVSKLLRTAKQLDDTRIAVEINDTLYVNFDASTIWPGVEYTLTDFCGLTELPADKIIFFTADKTKISKIERLLGDHLYWEISENEVLMVMNKDARKRNAINALAMRFGMSLSEVVAFGDDHNDVEMLRECGIGVAVANAIDEAKAIADFVCETNDDDGVARWIEKRILVPCNGL
jgi:Cof subfamily protein (haloacid dehalogenase superfamily)